MSRLVLLVVALCLPAASACSPTGTPVPGPGHLRVMDLDAATIPDFAVQDRWLSAGCGLDNPVLLHGNRLLWLENDGLHTADLATGATHLFAFEGKAPHMEFTVAWPRAIVQLGAVTARLVVVDLETGAVAEHAAPLEHVWESVGEGVALYDFKGKDGSTTTGLYDFHSAAWLAGPATRGETGWPNTLYADAVGQGWAVFREYRDGERSPVGAWLRDLEGNVTPWPKPADDSFAAVRDGAYLWVDDGSLFKQLLPDGPRERLATAEGNVLDADAQHIVLGFYSRPADREPADGGVRGTDAAQSPVGSMVAPALGLAVIAAIRRRR